MSDAGGVSAAGVSMDETSFPVSTFNAVTEFA